MSCPTVVKVSVPGGPAVARVVTPGPKGLKGDPGDQGEPGADYYYQPRQTVTAVDDVYTLNITEAKEFTLSAPIDGPATFNLTGLEAIPQNEVWRGVLRFDYTSGLTDLGTLGADSAMPRAMSSDGTIIAARTNFNSQTNTQSAFLWSEAGGITNLGTLGSGTVIEVTGLSGDGIYATGVVQDGGNRSFLWTEATGMIEIGQGIQSLGISNDGTTIIGGFNNPALGGAFFWRESSGLVDIGNISEGGFSTYANGCSANGDIIVGYGVIPGIGQRAFRWSETTGMVDLGSFGDDTSATCTSNDGSIIAGYSKTTGGAYIAFKWTETTGLVGLETLGGIESYPTAISADGSVIVGQGTTSSNEYRACIWVDSKVIDLGASANSFAVDISEDKSLVLVNDVNRVLLWNAISWFPENTNYSITWADNRPVIPNAGEHVCLAIEVVGGENIIRVAPFLDGEVIPPVRSVAGKVGNIVLQKGDVGLQNVDNTSDVDKPISTATQAALDELTPADIGAEPAGAAATAVSSHEAAADPHPGYVQQSDSRLALADSAVQPADLATVATSGAYGDLSGLPTLGTAAPLNVAATGNASAAQVVKGDDSRLSDARTPTAHTQPASTITGLATVATSGAYSDLSGRFDPTSPGAIGGTTPASGTFTWLSLPAQASTPLTPGSGFRIYANNNNAMSWVGANGFTRTFDGTANTANRVYTLPDLSGGMLISSTTGITGAGQITNIISISQANYDAIATKNAQTLYIISG